MECFQLRVWRHRCMCTEHGNSRSPALFTSWVSESSRTRLDSALSFAFSSLVCCSPRLQNGHAHTHLHGHGCAVPVSCHGDCFHSGVLCCCLVRCPSPRRSCQRTHRWIHQLHGGRDICSTLDSKLASVAQFFFPLHAAAISECHLSRYRSVRFNFIAQNV